VYRKEKEKLKKYDKIMKIRRRKKGLQIDKV
jgi:hypothetical protein